MNKLTVTLSNEQTTKSKSVHFDEMCNLCVHHFLFWKYLVHQFLVHRPSNLKLSKKVQMKNSQNQKCRSGRVEHFCFIHSFHFQSFTRPKNPFGILIELKGSLTSGPAALEPILPQPKTGHRQSEPTRQGEIFAAAPSSLPRYPARQHTGPTSPPAQAIQIPPRLILLPG
jgi:hypothetical protein